MRLAVNLRHLAAHPVHLEGELPLADLDIDTRDEMIQLAGPLRYDLEVEKLEEGLLVQGELNVPLQCTCVRCLKSFAQQLDLPHWTAHVPLQGEEAAPVVNDCVDLTPLVREDILLEFPQHPLCDPQCRGLPDAEPGQKKQSSGAGQTQASSAAWAELNKLKF
jgi:DUF177 domain-containing protein